MDKQKAIDKLVTSLGGQTKAAAVLGVSQPTVNGWASGKHGVSVAVSIRAERVTGGEIRAADLCPELRGLIPAA